MQTSQYSALFFCAKNCHSTEECCNPFQFEHSVTRCRYQSSSLHLCPSVPLRWQQHLTVFVLAKFFFGLCFVSFQDCTSVLSFFSQLDLSKLITFFTLQLTPRTIVKKKANQWPSYSKNGMTKPVGMLFKLLTFFIGHCLFRRVMRATVVEIIQTLLREKHTLKKREMHILCYSRILV